MRTAGVHRVKKVKRTAEYRIWFVGDIHWGDRGCAEDLADETIARIRDDPGALWFGMGDYWSLISFADTRFDPTQVAPEARAAYFIGLGKEMIRQGADKFAPIAGKCLGLLQGNHEYRYGLANDTAIVEDLCETLKVPFLGYSAFKDVEYQQHRRFRLYVHHGAGWAQTKGGKLNRLLQFVRSREADIIAMGHVHALLDDIDVSLAANVACTKVSERLKLSLMTGSYLRGYHDDGEGGSSYVERAGMSPTALGSPCIVFRPATGRVSVEKPVGHLGRKLSG